MNLLLLNYLLVLWVWCWSWWNEFVLWLLLHYWLRWWNWFKFVWELAAKLLMWLLALWYDESQALLFELLSVHHLIEVLPLQFGNLIVF